MKKVLYLFLMLSLFTLTGCKDNGDIVDDDPKKEEDKAGRAYALVHTDYVGFAEVNKGNGVVIRVVFDEAFLPNIWAQETAVDSLTDYVVDADNKPLTNANNFKFAKYLKIGDKVFTGTIYTDAEKETIGSTKQTIKYQAEGIDDLYTYLKTEDNARWYVEQIKAGNAYITNSDGTRQNVKTNPQGSFFKSSSLYWTTGDTGWAKNLQFLANGIVGTDMSKTVTMSDGYVKIGDVVTSATIADYEDYYNLAKKAFENAK